MRAAFLAGHPRRPARYRYAAQGYARPFTAATTAEGTEGSPTIWTRRVRLLRRLLRELEALA